MAEPTLREEVAPGAPPRLELSRWQEQWAVTAGITTRGTPDAPGDMGLAGPAPIGEVLPRWHRLRSACSPAGALVAARQVHGCGVRWHDRPEGGGVLLLEGLDGHATGAPGVLLCVTVADCIPVYVVDPVRRLIALLHAGWRGTAAGMLGAGIAALTAHGAYVGDLVVHLGVGICGGCYEVGADVLAAFGMAPDAEGRGRLDLRAVLARQAREAGAGTVSVSPWCAAHDRSLFFSHRASGGRDGSRMVAYLGLLS